MVKDIRFDRTYKVRRTNEDDSIYMYRAPGYVADVETAIISGGYKKAKPVEVTRWHLASVLSHEKAHDVLLSELGWDATYGYDVPEVSRFVDQGIKPRQRKSDYEKYIFYLDGLISHQLIDPEHYILRLQKLRDDGLISPAEFSALMQRAIYRGYI